MRYFLYIILVFFSFLPITFAQPKAVYVSIDISASMRGNKYNLANYTVQMITALMEDDDELYLSICGDFKKVNTGNNKRQNEINALQKSIYSYKIILEKTEIGDVKEFMRVFKNNPNKEQWYFIVGDGYWRTSSEVCSQFHALISQNPLYVCFLETMKEMSEHGDFGECLDDLSYVMQYRSSNNPQTIINNLTHVATSLFKVSDESAAVKQVSDNKYSFTSEIPVKKIYIVYQDEIKTNKLPTLLSAKYDGKSVQIARQSIVTTEKLCKTDEELLSGQVIVLNSGSLLQPNQAIEFTFDKPIDESKLKIYPMVDIKLSDLTVLAETGIPQTKGNETVICLENNKVKILYELLDSEGNTLPESILQKTTAVIKTDGGEFKSTLNNGIFECVIPLNNKDEVFYSISTKCGGYFNLISEKQKIIRNKDCEMPVEGKIKSASSIHIKELMKKTCSVITIFDRNNPSKILNPNDYEIDIKRDFRHLFKDIEITNITNENFEICFQPRNLWCECFLPDTLTLTFYTKDKTGEYAPNEQIIKFHIDKTGTTWFERCSWVIFCAIGTFVLILYLSALTRKKRFKKGSAIRYQYFGVGGIKSRENIDDLRKKGLFAWFYRWFIPFGTEKSSKVFNKANNKLFSFSPTASNQRIEFPKQQYNPKEMNSIDFDRDQFESRLSKTFTMSDNTMIKITLPSGKGSFHFCYDRASGSSDDIPAFKAFIRFLMILAVVFEIFLIYFLITSIL